MARFFIALLIGSTICSGNAWAGFESGNKLKDGLGQFEGRVSTFDAGFSSGYVVGVFDALEGWEICPPSNVTLGQVTAVVLKYMNDHPENLNLQGSVIAFAALAGTWPCRKASPPAARKRPQPTPKKKGDEDNPF